VRAEWGPQVLEAPREMKLRMTRQQLPPPRQGFSPASRRTLRPGGIQVLRCPQ